MGPGPGCGWDTRSYAAGLSASISIITGYCAWCLSFNFRPSSRMPVAPYWSCGCPPPPPRAVDGVFGVFVEWKDVPYLSAAARLGVSSGWYRTSFGHNKLSVLLRARCLIVYDPRNVISLGNSLFYSALPEFGSLESRLTGPTKILESPYKPINS